jgi:hypothetical protein
MDRTGPIFGPGSKIGRSRSVPVRSGPALTIPDLIRSQCTDQEIPVITVRSSGTEDTFWCNDLLIGLGSRAESASASLRRRSLK